jgi:NAD(P)-dependent dehydrogenase (short-subunit alcohol dehydrogenase family)
MTNESAEFGGLAALVTGGASGIGLATARLLAARGARVAVLDRADGIEALKAGQGSAAGEWPDLYPVVADVTDDAAVRAAVAEAGRALGRLDIVVNNAGIGAAGTVEDNDDAEWHRVLDVNVLGIVRVTRAALPFLRDAVRDRGQAAIVNTCSVAAIAGLPQRAVYSASKGAVYSLTLAMAADHVAEGIRVNCVTPGTADTRRPQRPPADGPPGHRGRGRRGHRLPGQPGGQRHHRHGPGRGRRHGGPAPPAALLLTPRI